ncbi:hypothetical protein LAG90_01590 [Marinilongibacter aquaticus]|uniref:hypothetical protein n=1 Tax=Marinilongibacter aquaticus TaxID=2975157 RepID=UPI0021BD452A|nr:hypothetical protein [Marinilongibacter aquaticus]UBM59349.1 hypothetical protein LAG90_01590 [Marinilongibacter aquaticus]
MKNWLTLSFACITLGSFAQNYPQASISNGVLNGKVYLPESETGYYQGTRFDWAGVVSSLTYKGHEFFGQWNASTQKGLHDAIMGPVEEFMELGYDEAEVGETFLRIGVGALEKPDEKAQSRFKTYEIKDQGKRKVKVKGDGVRFSQKIKIPQGYGYLYKKELKLLKDQPVLVLSHSLKNTGDKVIETSVYNHNFFVIDGEHTNENIKTTFAYDPKAEGKGFGSLAEFEGRALIYKRELRRGENVFSENIEGFGDTADDYRLKIENLKSGAEVTITCDKPIEKMVFWSCQTTSCPEPYVKLSIAPGETIKWNIQYEFKSKLP